MAVTPQPEDRPRDDRALHHLIGRYLDGDLTEQELEELEQRLRSDEAARREYNRVAKVHSELAWQWRKSTPAVEDGDRFLLRHMQRDRGGRPRAQSPASEAFAGRESLLRRLPNWAVAACVLPVALAVGWYVQNEVYAPKAPDYVATVAALEKCVWGRGDLDGSRLIEAGTSIELLQGRADLAFDTGVQLAVVAPASISILSGGEAHLEWGRIIAEVPPASNFVVQTPHAKVDRSSEKFGVHASQYETAVHSLQGNLSVLPAAYRGSPSDNRILAGKSARYTARDEAPARGEATPEAFPDLAGGPTKVLAVRGPIEFLDRAPISIGPCSLENDEKAYLVPERVGAVIATQTLATFVDSGRHMVYSEPWPEISPGTKVDSYLIVFNPVGSEKRNETTGLPPAAKGGEITFNRPIVGVMAFADHLEQTDEYLGALGTEYLSTESIRTQLLQVNRGVWKRGLYWRDETLSNGQYIEISEDRRTLKFHFVVTGKGPDQARVLVSSAE